MQRLGELHVTAAPWTAPPAFKTGAQNAEPQGWVGGKLQDKPHVLCSWVNYLCYYVVKYAFDFNLEIASLSLQNEPRRLPSIFAQTWETMFYSPNEYAEAVAMLLYRIKELNLRVKLILFDDQKALLPDWVEPLMRIPSVAEELVKKGGGGCIEAIGFHAYMWPESSQAALKKPASCTRTCRSCAQSSPRGFPKCCRGRRARLQTALRATRDSSWATPWRTCTAAPWVSSTGT